MKRLLLPVLGLVMLAQPVKADDLGAQTRAAQETAQHNKKCAAIGDFYWEIGNAKEMLASGHIGSKFSADTSIGIDSASKLVFGSYALEKIGHAPSEEQVRQLTMTGGYAHTKRKMMSCGLFTRTVAECASKEGANDPDPQDFGVFSYGGPGDEKLAMDLGDGDLDRAGMAAEYKKYLGSDLDFTFRNLLMAGGLKSTPANYARFLRKILAGQLHMKEYLGSHAVCTSRQVCPGKANVSPAPLFPGITA